MKKQLLLLIITMMICVSSCAVTEDEDTKNTASDTAVAETQGETSYVAGTMPAEWPDETVEPTVYPVVATESSSEITGTVSLSYPSLLQGDRCAVNIDLKNDGQGVKDYQARLRYKGEGKTVDIPIQCYEQRYVYADIPADALCGAYDLVIQAEAYDYEGVVENMVTVSKREKTAFSFAYALNKAVYSAQSKDVETFSLAIYNEGDPLIIYDNDYVYNVSEAYFTKTENGETQKIDVLWYTHSGIDWEEQYIAVGEPSVDYYQVFFYGAEPGIYDLVVSYNGFEHKFEKVIEITP